MATPVLTQNDKSKSLAGSKAKKKKKENYVTVLYGSGTIKVYRLEQSSAQILDQKLSDVFNFVAPVKPKWSEMKKIPKKDRAGFKKSLSQPPKPSRKCLIFGINAVMRAIEKGVCTVVLVASDLRPPLMLRHISDCCSAEKIPLIQVSMLKYILLNNFGFPGFIVAIREVPEDDPLHSVLEYLLECFPEMQDEITSLLQNLKLKSLEAPNVANPVPKINIEKGSDHVEFTQSRVNPKSIYLIRSDTQIRCFVPASPKEDLKHCFNSDFIPFREEEPEKAKTEMSKKMTYKELSVKRLQPNPDRKKGKKKKNLQFL